MFFQNILKRWAELDEMAQDPMHAYISMLLMFANDHVEKSMKEFCKNKTTCRREFLSAYFNSVISKPQYACCDICEEIESIRGKEFKMPTLQQRQQLIESIEI